MKELKNEYFSNTEKYILEAIGVKKYFNIRKGQTLKAVDGVTLEIPRGKTLGVVGESGSGKTTLGRCLLGLNEITAGKVFFNGTDISRLKDKEFNKIRTRLQVVFQDPYSSLSPRMAIGDIIGEAVKVHKITPKKELRKYVVSVMEKCGLSSECYNRYPHEFSGGQRQRVCIARALAVKPEFVVCDEPVSALDVSAQAQIINLLKDLQKEMELTYMFISHDLSVVKYVADTIAVMYLGSVVEMGETQDICFSPKHPYTKALFSAIPVAEINAKRQRIILQGEIPNPANMPKGCKFVTRCKERKEICFTVPPPLKEYKNGQKCACHLYTGGK